MRRPLWRPPPRCLPQAQCLSATPTNPALPHSSQPLPTFRQIHPSKTARASATHYRLQELLQRVTPVHCVVTDIFLYVADKRCASRCEHFAGRSPAPLSGPRVTRAAAPPRRNACARHYTHTNCARAADSLVFRASTASARATTMALHPAAHTHATALPAARFLAKLCVDTLSAGTQSDANSWHSCSSITRPRTQCSTTRPRPTRSSTTPSARTRQRTGASSQAMPPCRCARTIAARTIVIVASRHLIAN